MAVKSSVLLVVVLLTTASCYPPSPLGIAKGIASKVKDTVAPSIESAPEESPEPGSSPDVTNRAHSPPVESSNNSEAKEEARSVGDHAKSLLEGGTKAVSQASKKVADVSKDVAAGSKDAVAGASKKVTDAAKDAAAGSKDAVVGASKKVTDAAKDVAAGSKNAVVDAAMEVVNVTKDVVQAGTELVAPDDVCYGELGCFSMSAPWFTLLRPLPAPDTPEKIATRFYLYTRGRRERFTAGQGGRFCVDGSGYEGGKETFFITHGFASNGNSSWLSDMKDAILKRHDANVFLVDWGKGASTINYFQVASNTRVVGATLAKLGKYLISEKGADSSRFHIIGHSLGAHISSYAAKNITNVARLTALDPAQPAFEGYDKAVRLNADDADFVEVIHTSSRPFVPLLGLGMIQAYGHVDFYMNGGWNQPGCVLPDRPNITSFLELAAVPVEVISDFISCPHGRSYEFLTASLAYDNCIFWGHQVSVATKLGTVLSGSLLSKQLISSPVNDCDELTCSPLGFDAILFPGRGAFSVATSGDDPFCVHEPDADSKMRRYRGWEPHVAGRSVHKSEEGGDNASQERR